MKDLNTNFEQELHETVEQILLVCEHTESNIFGYVTTKIMQLYNYKFE